MTMYSFSLCRLQFLRKIILSRSLSLSFALALCLAFFSLSFFTFTKQKKKMPSLVLEYQHINIHDLCPSVYGSDLMHSGKLYLTGI